jgi:hypothetical protein
MIAELSEPNDPIDPFLECNVGVSNETIAYTDFCEVVKFNSVSYNFTT